MSAYPSHIWEQIRGLTTRELMKALKKDGWQIIETKGSRYIFFKKGNLPQEHVEVHFHKSSSTYGSHLLKSLLDEIGWKVEDLKRLDLAR